MEKNKPTVEDILQLLPQIQCGHCGYDDCKAYAQAIAAKEADINRCARGGQSGIHLLAELLDTAEPALDTSYGTEKPLSLALIDESKCTGCTICIQTCPFDAIAGTGKMAHTVIRSLCTGCERCIARCPVDCIDMIPVSGTKTGSEIWSPVQAMQARERYERRLFRLQRESRDETIQSSGTVNETKKSDILKKIMARAKPHRNLPESTT